MPSPTSHIALCRKTYTNSDKYRIVFLIDDEIQMGFKAIDACTKYCIVLSSYSRWKKNEDTLKASGEKIRFRQLAKLTRNELRTDQVSISRSACVTLKNPSVIIQCHVNNVKDTTIKSSHLSLKTNQIHHFCSSITTTMTMEKNPDYQYKILFIKGMDSCI